MKRVVVVGGGFAGAKVAQLLQRFFSVTLIDNKTYYEFTPSVLRTLVEPKHTQAIQKKHTEYAKEATIVCGRVTRMTDQVVFVKQTPYPYDYLVLATGSSYHSPIKDRHLYFSSRVEQLQQSYRRLHTANSILVVGGGVVGVELAAELCTHVPHKQITLVHSRNHLVNRLPSRAGHYAYQFLCKRGVRIILNERVTNNDKQGYTKGYTTSKGISLQNDITYWCTGIQPNVDVVRAFDVTLCTTTHDLRVTKYLQLHGYAHIFVAGDIAATGEEKLAQVAESHAKIVAHNIQAHEQDRKMKQWTARTKPMVISLGKWDGLLVYRNTVVTGTLPALLKPLIEKKTMWLL